MKYLVLISFFFVFLVLSGNPVFADKPLQGEGIGKQNSTENNNSINGGLSVPPDIQIMMEASDYDIIHNPDGSDMIQMEGYSSQISPGNPILPHKIYNVLLPPETNCSTLQLEMVSSQTKVIEGTYEIKAGGPVTHGDNGYSMDNESELYWGVGKEIVDGKNILVYDNNANYPVNYVELLPYAQMRTWKYARIDFYPFQYNPISKKLTLIEDAVVNISYKPKSDPGIDSYVSDSVMEDVASSFFVNYNTGSNWYGKKDGIDTQAISDYVIITTNLIKSNSTQLNSFIIHKQDLGFNVRVVTEDDFDGLTGQDPDGRAEKIRQWLINNYASLGIRYVLLIGDPDPDGNGIPMKMCYPRFMDSSDRKSPTDYFYADLTGNWDINNNQYYGEWVDYTTPGGVDLSPEVYVGRIPVYGNDYSTLDSIFQKIISYETESESSWRNTTLLPMSFSDAFTDGAALAEQMKDDYLDPSGYSSWRVYQQGNGACSVDSPYTSEEELRGGVVKNRWKTNDYGIVCWWGHGGDILTGIGYSGCEDGTILQSKDTVNLDNAHPAFTYQCSCNNGYPETTNNLQYSILKNGGVSTIGATRVSWYYQTQSYGTFQNSPSNSGMGYEYVKRIVQNKPSGDALFQTKININPPDMDLFMNWFVFNLYGDPSLSLRRTVPMKPMVTTINPALGQAGTSVPYTVTGSNFESGAIVNLTKSGQNNITNIGSRSGSSLTGTFVLPADCMVGPWNVSVNQGGLFSNDDVQFTITAGPVLPPMVSSINPAKGQVGTSVPFMLTGNNFVNGAIVNLTGSYLNNITSIGSGSGSSLTGTFFIPFKYEIGLLNVSVNQGGLFSNDNVQFNITSDPTKPPVVCSVIPTSGKAGTNVPFTLTGSNFVDGAIVNLTKTGQGNITTIGAGTRSTLTGTFVLPSGCAVGPWNISVNQGGIFSNDDVRFTIRPALPVITNLNPGGCLQNSYSGPFQINITGTCFNIVNGTNNVTVDGLVVPYVVESPTRINATFPATIDDTLGNHPVIVWGEGGSSAAYNFVVSANGFTINATTDGIGWIDPSGIFYVDPGTPVSFSFKPSAGALIKNLTLNGIDIVPKPVSNYTIDRVNQNYDVRLHCEPLPGVIIAAFKATSLDGNSVRFTDSSWGESMAWKWDFGDGSGASTNSVDHTYTNPGTYTVSLWARNNLSQSQVVMGEISIPMTGEPGSSQSFSP